MSRISIGHSPPRPCSGKKTRRRCRNNEAADDIILIDVDSDNFDDVIIIDTPDSLPKKNEGASMLGKDKWPFRNVINIDDDDIADNSPFDAVNNVSFSAGTTSHRESSRVAQNFGDSATPVRLSKCKRTYCGKAFKRNHYGLDTDSECDSSDSDYPDCELVEDSFGQVQEQWEKAFSRRRKDVHNDNSGIRVHDSTPHFINKDNHPHAASKDETSQQKEASFCFTSGNSNNKNDASYPFKTKMDTDFGYTNLSDDDDDDDDDAMDDMYDKKSDTRDQSNSQAKRGPSVHAEQAECMDCEHECSGSHVEERNKNPASSNFASQEGPSKKFDHAIPIVEDEETSEVGPCSPESDLFVDKDSCNGKFSPNDGEATTCKSKSSSEHKINQRRSFPGDKHKNIHETAIPSVKEPDHLRYKQLHTTRRAKEDNLMPERCSFERSTLPDGQTDPSSTPFCDAVNVSGKSLFSRSVLRPGEGEKCNHNKTMLLVPEIPLFGSIYRNEANIQEDNTTSDIQQQENKNGQLHSQNGDTSLETCLINEREKLKETDEYRRATEKEWASRQQALLIQAEEARCQRRLLKRRKAESMRLLDMERRQKERIEEMRNIQKKDEENMNLKETIRGEVRNELKKLEIQCKNMASLLNLLGIHVGSWPNPSPQEVQTAYKRALLTFHPDRAPQSDIRQQVEAEEKFKLINRLKEKLPPS